MSGSPRAVLDQVRLVSSPRVPATTTAPATTAADAALLGR